MKKHNRILQNRCTVRGQVIELDPIDWKHSRKDLYLLVETTLPDGTFTYVPCMAARGKLRDLGELKEGDWVTVSGALVVSRDKKISWLEARIVDRVESKDDREYCNFAALQGEMLESGCMLDHGKPVMADFLLCVGDPDRNHLEIDCFAGEAVQDYLDCLTCGEVQVFGKLDFSVSEEKELRFFVDVCSMTSVPPFEATKANRKGGRRNDS